MHALHVPRYLLFEYVIHNVCEHARIKRLMAFDTMLAVLLLSQKLGRAMTAGPDDRLILVLLDYVFLERSSKLKLLQSLPVCLLPFDELFLQLLVLGSVAMFGVYFLALKAFNADHALELICFKEALWLRVVKHRRHHDLLLNKLRLFFRGLDILLIHVFWKHALIILKIGLQQLLPLENMLLSQSFLLWLRPKLLRTSRLRGHILIVYFEVMAH